MLPNNRADIYLNCRVHSIHIHADRSYLSHVNMYVRNHYPWLDVCIPSAKRKGEKNSV